MIDPNDYWVNNPLISDVNKALMYDNDIDAAVSGERERIIKLWNDWCDEIHPEQEAEMKKLQADWTTEQTRAFFIALIKGENK